MKLSISYIIIFLYTLLTVSYAQEVPKMTIDDSIKNMFSESMFLRNKNRNTQAMAVVNDAFALAEKYKRDSLIGASYFYYATIYRAVKDYKNSEIYYKKAIQYQKDIHQISELSGIYNTYASLLLDMKKEKEAFSKYNEAIKYAVLTNNKTHNSSPLVNLANYYYKKEEYEKAKTYARKAIQVIQGFSSKKYDRFLDQVRALSWMIIGVADIKSDDFESGDIYLKKALDYYIRQGDDKNIATIYFRYYEYYIQIKDSTKAFDYHLSYAKHDKKYNKELLEEKIKENEELKQFEDNVLALEIAQKEVALQKEQKKRLKYSLLLLSFFVILFIISIIILSKKNKTLKKLRESTVKISEQKSKFIAMISHEIKTPLHSVIGFNNILLEESPRPSQKKYLQFLKNASNHLLLLVDNMLNHYRSNSYRLEAQNSDFKFRECIQEVVDTFTVQLKNKNDNLLLSIDPTIPKILHGDHLKLNQILINLISNAIKFTEGGTVWVSAILENKSNTTCRILFEVKDTGIGISKADQKGIFDEFGQKSQNINKEFQGSGLGLSIVKQLLESLESTINIESEENKGSQFSFSLAFKYIELEIPKEITDIDLKKLEGLQVLVVEDHKLNQLIIAKTLKKNKMEFSICDNGLVAVETFNSKPLCYYDLILMDIHMPVMNGYDATLKIREKDHNIPILALTAVEIDFSSEDLKRLGLTDVVSKPYKESILYQKIIEYCFN